VSQSTGNGGSGGVWSTVRSTVSRVSPENLAVLVLNMIFVMGLFWLSDKQNSARERVLMPLMAACANSVPMEAIKLLTKSDHSKGP